MKNSITMKNKKRRHKTQPIEWKEAMLFLSKLNDDGFLRERLLFALGFYTGLRISDFRGLQWCNVVMLDGSIKQNIALDEQKTGKHRQIELNAKLRSIILQTYKGESLTDFLFVSQRHQFLNKPLTVAGCNYIIEKMFKRYGLEAANYSSHTLRKTFGRRIWECQGKTDEALICLSQIFNHTNIATTRRYIGITDEVIKDLYRML
jgi:integrase